MDNKQNGSVPTTLGLLGIAFIVLKLCNVINWSWWLVTLPFWGGLALILVILGTFFIMKFIYKMKL